MEQSVHPHGHGGVGSLRPGTWASSPSSSLEMVDAALAATDPDQSRLRDLPARVVVYLLVAGCLFVRELGYGRVWQRLCAGLDGLPLATPTASASPRPAAASGRAAADAVRAARWPGPGEPSAGSGSVGCWCAPSTAPPTRCGRHPGQPWRLHHPAQQPRRLGLSAAAPGRLGRLPHGTRSLIAVFGPTSSGEATMTKPSIAEHLHAGMLVLCDLASPPTLTGHRRHRPAAGALQGQPQAADGWPPARRLLAIGARRGPGPRRRRPDHHRHPRRPGQPGGFTGWPPP